MLLLLLGNSFWTTLDALEKSSLNFLAWDMSNGEQCGEQTVNVTRAQQDEFLSEFQDVALLKQLRRGCDGTAGTVGQIDACDVCQGDNSTCTDCAGVVNGKALRGKSSFSIIFFLSFLSFLTTKNFLRKFQIHFMLSG